MYVYMPTYMYTIPLLASLCTADRYTVCAYVRIHGICMYGICMYLCIDLFLDTVSPLCNATDRYKCTVLECCHVAHYTVVGR